MVTTKKLHENIVHEILWSSRGDTNINMQDNGVKKIWERGPMKTEISPGLRQAVRCWKGAHGQPLDQLKR